jgi:carbonic anhydrase
VCQYCLDAASLSKVLARRSILKLTAGAAAAFAISGPVRAANNAPPPKPENVISPNEALARLVKGNIRYVHSLSRRVDFSHERVALTSEQNPFAAILSCADSRIAPEFCFDVARGDVFVCRVAGNLASDEIIASMEYAVSVLYVPLIMVLGHESCGAVDAAIKAIKSDTALPGHLPSLVAAIRPAVEAVKDQPGDALVNATLRNVLRNADKLRTSNPIIKPLVDDNKVKVVGGIYKLASGKVELAS